MKHEALEVSGAFLFFPVYNRVIHPIISIEGDVGPQETRRKIQGRIKRQNISQKR